MTLTTSQPCSAANSWRLRACESSFGARCSPWYRLRLSQFSSRFHKQLADALIIATIGSSKCQFDTSTDALILLKQSGVSAPVFKAIVSGK